MHDGMNKNVSGLYLPNGYLDMKKLILGSKTPFIIVVVGRGTGKTYGGLETVIDEKIPSIYMRRTQTQHDFISLPAYSPFKKLNTSKGLAIQPFRTSKFTTDWYDCELDVESDKWVKDESRFVCTSTSLTAMHNMRGIDGSDYDLLFYDEFIPERTEKSIKDEGGAFLNAYETLNRNRELEGMPALKALLCSNSNQLSNPIFQAFGIVEKAERMKRDGQELSIMPDRGITLVIPQRTAIGEKKARTALYKASADKNYNAMALGNDFSYDTPTRIESRRLKDYRLLSVYKGIAIYAAKSGGEYYVSKHISGIPKEVYGDSEADAIRFRRQHENVFIAYINRGVIFETYSCEIIFKQIMLDKKA